MSAQTFTQRVNVSKPLADAFVKASSELPKARQQIEAEDLLLAIFDVAGRGAQVLNSIASGKQAQLKEYVRLAASQLGGRLPNGILELNEVDTYPIGSSAVETLLRSTVIANRTRQIITTDVLIIAEMSRQNSVLGNALRNERLYPRLDLIQAIASRLDENEEGSVPVRYQYSLPSLLAQDHVLRSTNSDTPSSAKLTKAMPTPASDLLSRVRQGDFGNVVLRDETYDILYSLDSDPLTILVTNQPEEALANVIALAGILAKDDAKYPYSTCIAIDQDALDATPATVVSTALGQAKNGIVYIPNIQELFSGPKSNETIASEIRKVISSKSVHIIGSLSQDDWRTAKKLRPFSQIQQPVLLLPPSAEKTVEIVAGMRARLEKEWADAGFSIKLSDPAIQSAARYASQYLTTFPQPASTIMILKRAYSMLKLDASRIEAGGKKNLAADGAIDADDVRLAMSEFGFEVQPQDPDKYLHMKEKLSERIIGQPEAIEAVTNAVLLAQAGGKDPRSPIGSFLFLGPSGVGKTELGRELSRFLFDDRDALIQIDMSEYMEKHNVARLIGAPPGYVGYEEGGQLTDAVAKKPYSIVMFDEVEKAAPEVWNLLLPVLDAGRLTDGKGKTVDFRNTLIVFTGNLGSEVYAHFEKLGREQAAKAVEATAKATFRPEFLGRLSGIVVFNPLSKDDLKKILDLQIRDLNQIRQQEVGISIEFTPALKNHLAEIGFSPQYGARNLKRIINTTVQSSEMNTRIISKEFKPGDTIVADWNGEKTVYSKKPETAMPRESAS